LEKFNQIILGIQEWFKRLSAENKRRLALFCTIVFALLLTISVLTSLKGCPEKEDDGMPERRNLISPIPAEELFLPDEPDYIPGVILEREQREAWTNNDANEHWQDVLSHGEEQWREKIEAAIDEYLERIP